MFECVEEQQIIQHHTPNTAVMSGFSPTVHSSNDLLAYVNSIDYANSVIDESDKDEITNEML